MRIVCPQCHFSKNIDPASIPDAALMVTCPKCKTRFPFTPGEAGQDDDFAFSDKDNRMSPAADTSPGASRRSREFGRAFDGREAYFSGRKTSPGGRGIPWENPGFGSFSAFFGTIKEVLFRPSDFYTNMPVAGGLKPPLIFGLIFGSVGVILSLFWSVFWSIITFNYGLANLPDLDLGSLLPISAHPIAAVAVLMGCIPFLVVFSLLIWSVVTHILLALVLGNKSGFEATFRVLSYSLAASLFYIIPFLGGLLAGLWGLVLEVVGLSRAHGIGLFRVIFAVLFLPALLGILAMIALLMASGLISPPWPDLLNFR
jgi:predicted Zn finger-like uncharacterized protein